MKSMKKLWYKIHQPKLKAKYQFGSPIVGVYVFEGTFVVATKLDIYISADGVKYERVQRV